MLKRCVIFFLLLISLSSCLSVNNTDLPVATINAPENIQQKTLQFQSEILPSLTPNYLSTPAILPDQECPTVVDSLATSFELFTYATLSEQIKIFRVEDDKFSILSVINGVSTTPYLSLDGNWIYWVNIPALIEAQGQFSSSSGSKTLTILNLNTNERHTITLSDDWLTALPQGWTKNGDIQLMTNIQQLEDRNNPVRKDFVIINPETGTIDKEISQTFDFPNNYYSIHPNYGFAQYNPNDTGILYTGLEPYTVYYVDVSGNEIWRSNKYTYIYSGLGGNVWSPNGENAVYFSSMFLDPFDEKSNFMYIFNEDDHKLQEIKIPNLVKSDRQIFASWSWSPHSDYVEVSFSNKKIFIEDALDTIVDGDGSITVGTGFLIDIENYALRPICFKDGYYWGGGFYSIPETIMIFTTIDIHGQATVWVLDIERWKMMKAFSYQVKDENIQVIGARTSR
jgi:hypothetical protein